MSQVRDFVVLTHKKHHPSRVVFFVVVMKGESPRVNRVFVRETSVFVGLSFLRNPNGVSTLWCKAPKSLRPSQKYGTPFWYAVILFFRELSKVLVQLPSFFTRVFCP